MLLPKQYSPEFKFVNRKFRLAIRGEVFSEGDKMGVLALAAVTNYHSRVI